nr:uncharacterized protein LOC119164227 [Rhipicephalus microplus]
MALSALEKIYSSRIKAIDERIEETLEEIDRYLKSGNQKDLNTYRKSSLHSVENISAKHNAIRECLQKMLHLCHEQPDSTEAIFSILKKMIQHLLPFKAACDCGICADCLEDTCDNSCKKQHACIANANPSDFQPSEDVKSLWCSICYHTQAYITRRLIGDSELLSPNQGLVCNTNWESYFEMLRLLFVAGQVQRIHQWVRSEQLRRASCLCKPTVSKCCVTCLMQWCLQSLTKDVAMRPPLGMTWHDLSDSYISSVRANVMLCLREIRSHWQRRNHINDVSLFLPCLLNPYSCWAHKDGKHSQYAYVVLQKSESYSDWTDHWIVVALVNLISELQWFEQQLNGISRRTWAVLSKSPQQASTDGTTAWDEPCIWEWQQLLAGSGVLTMLQQSIQDLIQIKRTFHQNDNVSVDFAGAKLQVSAIAFHAIHYLATYEPAVSACQGALEPFRASFIHAVHVAMGQALRDLEAGFELRSHMPQSLYIMLNTGRFLDNSLTNFISALSGKNEQARSLKMLSQVPELKLVLQSVYDALFLICSNTQELVGLPASPVVAGPIVELHRHCNALFNSISTNDTELKHNEQQPDNKHDQQAPWLCFMQPSLFPGPPWAQLPTNTQIWLPLALCLASERPQPLLLLQASDAQSCTLSTLLASQAAIQAKSHDTADNEKHFLAALLSVLMLCDYHTSEFTSVLVSVVEKLDGWREFESSSLGKATSEVRCQSLYNHCILMHIVRSRGPGGFSLCKVSSLATPILTSAREKQCLWLHQMWKEIEQHFRTSRHDLQGESLLVELLSCTMAVVPTLPAPLLACLTRLSELAAKVGVVSANNSAGMQVLLSTLYDILHSSTQLNELFGSLLDSEISVECAHIANEMAAHALQLTQRHEDRLLGSPDCDQRVLNCMDLLAGLLAAERDASREESLSQTAEDITLDLVAEQLMRTPQGPQNIEYLHTVLHQNEAWIRHTLAIPALDHHSVTLPLHNALLLGSSRQATREPRFDPLQAYNACMRIVQECNKVQTPQ